MHPIYQGRSQVRYHLDYTEISIPSPKNWFLIFFVGFCLLGWYYGLTQALLILEITRDGVMKPNGFVIFWLVGWSLIGIFVFLTLLWGIFGHETLILETNKICLRKSILGLGKTWILKKSRIKGICFKDLDEPIYTKEEEGEPWGFYSGKVCIDYGRKSYHFGMSLPNLGAIYLVEILNEHLA